jgi:hypothetical protein
MLDRARDFAVASVEHNGHPGSSTPACARQRPSCPDDQSGLLGRLPFVRQPWVVRHAGHGAICGIRRLLSHHGSFDSLQSLSLIAAIRPSAPQQSAPLADTPPSVSITSVRSPREQLVACGSWLKLPPTCQPVPTSIARRGFVPTRSSCRPRFAHSAWRSALPLDRSFQMIRPKLAPTSAYRFRIGVHRFVCGRLVGHRFGY